MVNSAFRRLFSAAVISLLLTATAARPSAAARWVELGNSEGASLDKVYIDADSQLFMRAHGMDFVSREHAVKLETDQVAAAGLRQTAFILCTHEPATGPGQAPGR